MADATTLRVMLNGYRNYVLRFSDVSDGTGLTNFKLYDATITGSAGVNQAGQIFYPGIHSKILKLDYDIQDMKVRLQWEATVNEDVVVLGNAPEDYDWTAIGGLPVPPGLAGATGSLLLTTLNAAPQSTCQLVMTIRKGVPQG